jgi:hypothetical protein
LYLVAMKAVHPNRIFNLGQRYYFASFKNSAPQNSI